MSNIIQYPRINCLQLYQQSDILNTSAYTSSVYKAFNPNYNHKGMDNDFMKRNLKNWQAQRQYWQPFQTGDTINLQWLGVDDDAGTSTITYTIRVLNTKGETVKELDVDNEGAAGSYWIRQVSCPLYDVPPGKYCIQIHRVGLFAEFDVWWLTEGFEVKETWPNTLLLTYSHTENDQDVFWETGIVMYKRVHAHLADLAPGAKFNVYEDQPLNQQLLSGVPFREWNLVFGSYGKRLPDYQLDNLNRITLCDTLYADTLAITRSEGARLEVKRTDRNPFAMAEITMREKVNDHTLYTSEYPLITLGAAPTVDWFYVEQLDQTTPGTVYPIQKYFNGAKAFVAYLNGPDSPITLPSGSHFAISNYGYIVLYTDDVTTYADYSPGLVMTDVLTSWMEVGIKTTTSQTDFEVNFDNGLTSVKYAFFWNDGVTSPTISTGTSLTQLVSYPAEGEFTAYLFIEDAAGITISGSLSNTQDVIKTLAGKLPANLQGFYCTGNVLENIKNNMIDSCTGGLLDTFHVGDNMLNTHRCNELMMYGYEALNAGCWAAPATYQFYQMTPLAPISQTEGLGIMRTRMLSAGVTVTTD